MRGEVDRLRFLPDGPNADEVVEERLSAPVSGGDAPALGPALVQDRVGKQKASRPWESNPVEPLGAWGSEE